ncbi:putative trehalose synthase-like protein [Phaeosphaeriaceae sp. PMI808]|nr:putative trehalose synthase-like protein [Phaeosphaeriaceae sp. PMI808]
MSSQAPTEVAVRPRCLTVKRRKTRESFKAKTSIREVQRQSGREGASLQVIYLGIAITENEEKPDEVIIGITAHDGTYSIEYAVFYYQMKNTIRVDRLNLFSGANSGSATPSADTSSGSHASSFDMSLVDFVVSEIEKYREKHYYKIAGGAITQQAAQLCPELPSLLWHKLDIVCFIFKPFANEPGHEATEGTEFKVDEESDSVVRKAIEKFGPSNLPRLMVKYRNRVGVDVDNKAHICILEDYRGTVHSNTWKTTMHFANSLKHNKIKIAFFNSTPQGGGVALMRHALIRFLRLVGVDCEWYVPRPKPEVFRITKNNHNILQGVDKTGNRLDVESMGILDDWCESNAKRYWTAKGRPLAARSAGGADVIIIDDPQMPRLVDIAKQNDPERPVIFRSHIQVRADLANEAGTPTAEVWDWVWAHVQKCDIFVSHPVPDFVPKNVTSKKVGYLPATTDWLDGLNKHMSDWDLQYYMHEFFVDILKRQEAFRFEFADKGREYIVQIARFDPAKGVPDVLAAYAYLRREFMSDVPISSTPQLVIAGHGAIDDPDATPIYDQTIALIKEHYADLETDIIVMRVGPTDQILNALMHNAHVALQLSTREGFEVKVSEALHHGVPIIATKRGGIPLQVHHMRSGYLVEAGDTWAVARYLNHLFTDKVAYKEMSDFAANSVSDEVSTVGNALSWLYLADTLAKGKTVEPNSRWINDMAREEAGIPYDPKEREIRLPRSSSLDLGGVV